MRMIVMLLLGLVIGAFGAVTAVSAMRQATPLSRGVMAMSGHHFGQLRKLNEGGRCDAGAIRSHLDALRMVANDVDTAFLPTGSDEEFQRYSADYRRALDEALAAAPSTCPALGESLRNVGATCKACHQDFR